MNTQPKDLERLRSIKTLSQLVAYLRDDLEWPIESDDIEDVTFDYDPEELGFDAASAVKFKEIKQIRPLETNQPWGIFWINFEKKRLPVVMLRRILASLAIKKRASARRDDRPAWHLHDLLFISAYGEDHDRAITFAHFWQDPQTTGDLPVLKVLGWDDGDTVLHLADAHHALVEKLRWPDDPADVKSWRERWASAFTLGHREVITTTQELVEELAKLAVAIRKRANTILARESKRGPMQRLYAAFQTALIHDLTEDDFADVIAQTISYGLLAARFSHPGGISVQHLVDMIPPTNPFLRELLEMFLNVAGRRDTFDFDELGIQDVVDLLNHANAEAVKADFGNRTKSEDPIVHFYEHFLKAYDAKKKVQRGVFYTPQPVVSYIVRSVHELLQTEFGIEDGLASTVTWGEMRKRITDLRIPDGAKPDDFFVVALDPATGTATFLVEIIEVIFTYLKNKWGKEGAASMPPVPGQGRASTFNDYWNAYVPHALLPRLYGYEIMMAPYIIAHMKLGLKLSEINVRLGQPDYQFKLKDRAHIYLTNSLEPPSDRGQQAIVGMFPALAHEAEAVNAVKRHQRFTIVIGNPPYAGHSVNNQLDWIVDKVYDYKRGLPDLQKPGQAKWLQDDYVKFIRFSEYLLEQVPRGLMGFITNHSFLDNPTFRGMRRHFQAVMPRIWLADLHGNAKKRERSSDGSADENVFDIQQGVAVTLAERTSDGGEVHYRDVHGSRELKYKALARGSVLSNRHELLRPDDPLWLFRPQDRTLFDEYGGYAPLQKLMGLNGEPAPGIVTTQDEFAISWSRNEASHKVEQLLATKSETEARSLFTLCSQSQWDYRRAKAALAAGSWRKDLRKILYRPFDWRWTVFNQHVAVHRRERVMRHMIQGGNIGLIATRQTKDEWGVLATRDICAHKTCGAYDINFLFPLFLAPESSELRLGGTQAHTNLEQDTLARLARDMGLKRPTLDQRAHGLRAEDVFHYAYGVFHSPTYRTRYAEFLKTDFPRLPLTSSLELFRSLARLGGELVALHLMESPKLDKHITKWSGQAPSQEVEKVVYSDKTVWIDKGKSEGFQGVTEDVWNFHIGGYQVCEKWLKDRKGRRLSAEDIEHYQRIVVALNETIRIMGEIDQAIDDHGGWPGAFMPKLDSADKP